MQVSVRDEKGQLTNLVRRAEAGDDIVLTRHDRAAVRLVPVEQAPSARHVLIEAVRRSAVSHVAHGSSASSSQDDFQGDDGLPH